MYWPDKLLTATHEGLLFINRYEIRIFNIMLFRIFGLLVANYFFLQNVHSCGRPNTLKIPFACLTNSVLFVRKRTIGTERPLFVGEVGANLFPVESVVNVTDPYSRYSRLSRPDPLRFILVGRQLSTTG
jgi:hypothetical protein